MMRRRLALHHLIDLPVVLRGPDRCVLTKKFLEGASRVAERWNGPVTFFMQPTDAGTDNLDNIEVERSSLPFAIEATPFDSPELRWKVLSGDVVVWLPNYKTHDLGALLRKHRIPNVYCTEYSLRTRLQIVESAAVSRLRKTRRAVWELGEERHIRRNLRRFVSGLECNGVPTYEAYKGLTSDVLLFFDNRITQDLLADDADLDQKQARLQNPDAPLRLVFSGRLNRMKGAHHLLPLAQRLRAQGVDFRLDVFGDGEELSALKAGIETAGLEGKVVLRGVVDFRDELVPLFKRDYDLFVCGHLQGDPSCTYLETFACGIPIVGYANEAFAGMLRHVDAGWSVALGNVDGLASQVKALSLARPSLNEKARRALTFAREHTFESTFARRQSFYEAAWERSQARRAVSLPLSARIRRLSVN
jgi:colanic acid/amylovoran biosynthesis glycosyltransferase